MKGAVKVNILLVDNDENNLRALFAALECLGGNLVQASSGRDALRKLLVQDFALILLDVRMPDLDGFETARLIRQRKRTRHVPIIFLTAIGKAEEDVRQGYALGAVDYLFKPFETEILRSKVAVFVELFRNREHVKRQEARLRALEERKLARKQLDRVRRQNALILSSAGEGIVGFDAAGRIQFLNPAAARMTGWQKGDRPVPSAMLEGARRGADNDVFTRKDGSSFPVEYTITPIREGGELATVIVFRDSTERRQLEMERARLVHELQEAVRVRDDFLAIASHELRTPLTPLRLLAQSAQRIAPGLAANQPKLRRWIHELQTMDRHIGRLEKLIDGLLDVSRISAGRLILELEEFDLCALVQEIVGRFRSELDRCGWTMTLPPAAVVGRWDRLRIDQVFTNLLTNAIKYGSARPIAIEVSVKEGRARISVQDHGVGIEPEHQHRIFERFERLFPISHFGGFGLGLWIVRQVAQAHGGDVRVKSIPGQGSTFTVELPCEAWIESAEAGSEAVAASGESS